MATTRVFPPTTSPMTAVAPQSNPSLRREAAPEHGRRDRTNGRTKQTNDDRRQKNNVGLHAHNRGGWVIIVHVPGQPPPIPPPPPRPPSRRRRRVSHLRNPHKARHLRFSVERDSAWIGMAKSITRSARLRSSTQHCTCYDVIGCFRSLSSPPMKNTKCRHIALFVRTCSSKCSSN